MFISFINSIAVKCSDWDGILFPIPPVFYKASKPLDLLLQIGLYTIIFYHLPIRFLAVLPLVYAVLAFHRGIKSSGFRPLMNVKRDAAFFFILKKEPLSQERDQFTLTSVSSLAVGILMVLIPPPHPRSPSHRQLICAVTLQPPAPLFQLAQALM